MKKLIIMSAAVAAVFIAVGAKVTPEERYERTTQEVQIFERTRRELENESSPVVWVSKNEALRRIGLRTIPNPKEQE